MGYSRGLALLRPEFMEAEDRLSRLVGLEIELVPLDANDNLT